MKDFLSKLSFSQLVIIELLFLFIFLSVGFNVNYILLNQDLETNGNEFSSLANSFLRGNLYLDKYPVNKLDCSIFQDRCYWDQGPFPAIVLMPFVFLFKIFNFSFYQSYLNIAITLALLIIIWKISKKVGYSDFDSLWLAFAFCFASVYLAATFNPISYYFAQAIVVFLYFLAIHEYLNKKRYFLIGLYFSFIFATRFTAGFGILFFILLILFKKGSPFNEKIKSIIIIFLPIFVAGLLLLYYNFIRFGNFFDNGYFTALAGPYFGLRDEYGLFNFIYLPRNFYYYFLKLPTLTANGLLPLPQVSHLGLSFFIISPIFIYLFRPNLKDKIVIFAGISSIIILFSILLYYNTGAWQFGPRYILDLLPLWFLILIYSFQGCRLNFLVKSIITVSAFLNVVLFLGMV